MTATTIEAALAAWVRAATGLADGAVRWGDQNVAQAARPMVTLRVISTRSIGQDWVQAIANPLVVADDVVESVSAVANTLTLTAHGLVTGDGPLRGTTTGTLPGGWALATDVFVIRVDANTIKLASSLENALNLNAIDLTTAGTGTHTISDTAATVRAGAEVLMTARGSREALVSIQCFGADAVGADSPRALLERVRAAAVLPSRRAAFVTAGIGMTPLAAVQSIGGVVGSSVFEPRATLEARIFITSEVSETGTFIESVAIENEDTGSEFDVP